MTVSVRRLQPGDESRVVAAADLFDDPPTAEGAADFLRRPGHHLLVAVASEGPEDEALGFVSCVEMTHPDKGTELFLYELGVADHVRRQGIGHQLVDAALDLARTLGCYGAWTITEDDNAAALATYRSADAEADPTAVVQTWDWRPA